MSEQNRKAKTKNTHEGSSGRVYDEHGRTGEGGEKKGHGMLNSDSFTSGTGSAIESPSEAN